MSEPQVVLKIESVVASGVKVQEIIDFIEGLQSNSIIKDESTVTYNLSVEAV